MVDREHRKPRREAEEIQSLILLALAKERGTLSDIYKFIFNRYGLADGKVKKEPRSEERIFIHLKNLEREGLVASKKEEREIEYSFKDPNETRKVRKKIMVTVYMLPENTFRNVAKTFLFIWDYEKEPIKNYGRGSTKSKKKEPIKDLIKDFMRSEWYISGCLGVAGSIYSMLKYSRKFYSYPLIDSLLADLSESEWKELSKETRKEMTFLNEEYKRKILTAPELKRFARNEIRNEAKFIKQIDKRYPDHISQSTEKRILENLEKTFLEALLKSAEQEKNLRKSRSVSERLTADLSRRVMMEVFHEGNTPFHKFLLAYYLSLDLGYYATALENLISHFPDSAHTLFEVFVNEDIWDVLDDRKAVTQEIVDKNIKSFGQEYWLNKKYELDSIYDYFNRNNKFEKIPKQLVDKKYFAALLFFEIMGSANTMNAVLDGPYFYSQLMMKNPWQITEGLNAYQERDGEWSIGLRRSGEQ